MNNQTPISQDSLSLVTAGISHAEIDKLLLPVSDPDLLMPDFGLKDELLEPDQNLPTIDEIEKILVESIVGTNVDATDPAQFIAGLLHPFVKQHDVYLYPGKGLKRPTYKIEIPDFNIMIGRHSVRIVAEQLHELASSLSLYPVGNRAPEGSPTFEVAIEGNSHPIIAPTVEAACQAARCISSLLPRAVYVPIKCSVADLIKYATAARKSLGDQNMGDQHYRQMAVDLISTIEELRVACTVILKRLRALGKGEQYRIEINASAGLEVDITDRNSPYESSHAKLAFLKRTRDLRQAIEMIATRSAVLQQLPTHLKIQIECDYDYSHIQIEDMSKTPYTSARLIRSSELDYSKVNELAQRLNPQTSQDEYRWEFRLPFVRHSKSKWFCAGPSIALGLAACAKNDKNGATQTITQLITDIISEDSPDSDVMLYRIVTDY